MLIWVIECIDFYAESQILFSSKSGIFDISPGLLQLVKLNYIIAQCSNGAIWGRHRIALTPALFCGFVSNHIVCFFIASYHRFLYSFPIRWPSALQIKMRCWVGIFAANEYDHIDIMQRQQLNLAKRFSEPYPTLFKHFPAINDHVNQAKFTDWNIRTTTQFFASHCTIYK